MSELAKAIRATIQIRRLPVDTFMLTDDSYRMSQTQAAGALPVDLILPLVLSALRLTMISYCETKMKSFNPYLGD
ncbi:MAG: hypothetical protein ACFB2W_06925 [Leptolyngbyaceae cyanobacterium]